jgi:acyl phosphate:glycerol-3-phosphate acyltransferase
MTFLAVLLSYFLGAIPFGVIVGKMRGVDVRAVGSGNIGTTNVWRTLGRAREVWFLRSMF